MDESEILVLRQKIHGMEADEYVRQLRQQLPEWTITHARTPDEEQQALQTADVVTGRRLTAQQLADAPELSLFACIFAGTSHLDLDAFEKHDLAVTNASGVHAPKIAEYIIGAMISHAQQFQRARKQAEHGEWRSYRTRELYDSTATVVGLGAIGTATVDRLDALGMDTVGVRYTPAKGGPADALYGFEDIHEAVVDAEYVILACPLTETTAELIDADVFQTMRSDATLINVARGPVVDTEALVSALRWNDIAGATLDVTDPEPLPEDHPLWTLDNVFITPHNAGHTPAYFERRATMLAENVSRLAADEPLENQVIDS